MPLEYQPGHRWTDRHGVEHWFAGSGVIAPDYVDEYVREGGEVIFREVGPWQTYQPTEPCPGCDCDPIGYAPHNGKGTLCHQPSELEQS
jgi:hypothetical protein